MGTRGFWGVRDNDRTRFTYNHFDSYPTGLGVDVAEFIGKTDLTTLGDRVFDLTLVEEGDTPTPEQAERLDATGVVQVTGNQEWYSALREAQGNPQMTIDTGFWMSLGFDPLIQTDNWLEWGYLIDLDAGELIVYEIVYKGAPKVRRRLAFSQLKDPLTIEHIMTAMDKEGA